MIGTNYKWAFFNANPITGGGLTSNGDKWIFNR